MIKTTDTDIDPRAIIETHLVTPAIVTADGLLGKFDTLRVALEHLQTHGTSRTLLSIQAPGAELRFAGAALRALVEDYTVWLDAAGLLDNEGAPGAARVNAPEA
jgi:hypothetical protein